jgi:hypothetical protein
MPPYGKLLIKTKTNEQRKTERKMIVCQRTGFVAEKSDKSMKILYETTSFPPAQTNLYPI